MKDGTPSDRRLRLASLDMSLSLGIVVVAVAACLKCTPGLAVKARLMAVFMQVTLARNDSHERFAFDGELPAVADVARPRAEPSQFTEFAFDPDGAGLVAHGTVGRDGHSFALSFVPAVSQGGAHLRWLCGLRRAPAGWRAASAPRVVELPEDVSYGACRDDGEAP